MAVTPLHSLRRTPALTLTVVGTLGVAIGAVVALFAVVRAVLMEPLPYPESERLVRLWETNPEVDDELHGPSPLNVIDWRTSATRLESMSAWFVTSATYRGGFGLEQIRTARVEADFFDVLGVEPAIGRAFRPEEISDFGPVVLSDRAWRRLFGADPAAVGAALDAGDRRHEIVGVMPPDFAFPDESVDVWMAWSLPEVYGDRPETRTWRFLDAVGRLATGVSPEAAEEELDAVAAGLAEAHPAEDRGWDVAVVPLREHVVGEARAPLRVAFGAVLFILLIACANVANLLLARVPARARELATRSALGASRGRLIRDLLGEHAALAVLSGAVGLLVATVLLDVLVAFDAGRIPRLAEASVDGAVLGFALAVAVVTGLVFGLAPTMSALGRTGAAALRVGTRSHSPAAARAREIFVASQVAVTVVLLVGAGLFQASFARLIGQDPGLEPENVQTFRVALDDAEADGPATVRYYEGLLDRLRDVPGVVDAGAAQTLPLHPVGNDFFRPYRPPGSGTSASEASTVQMRIVTPGYTETVGMRLVEGEAISETTQRGDPLVAMVNETLARRLWPEGGAVGASFEIDFREGWQPYRVVGVVQDVKHYGLRASARPEVFLAHAQVPYVAMSVAVRTVDDPATMVETLRSTVLSHVPSQPPHDFVTLEELTRASVADDRFLSVLLGLLAAIGLLLAATGVYGVIAYAVSHRRREIGIRMALGAEPRVVVGEVLKRALVIAGAGLGVGLVVALGLSGAVADLLFGVSPYDPVTTAVSAVGLMTVAAAAAAIPARRAARIAPSEAMRDV